MGGPDLDHVVEVPPASFLLCKVTVFPLHLVTLWKSSPVSPEMLPSNFSVQRRCCPRQWLRQCSGGDGLFSFFFPCYLEFSGRESSLLYSCVCFILWVLIQYYLYLLCCLNCSSCGRYMLSGMGSRDLLTCVHLFLKSAPPISRTPRRPRSFSSAFSNMLVCHLVYPRQ